MSRRQETSEVKVRIWQNALVDYGMVFLMEKLANGIDELASVVVEYGMGSLMREVDRVTVVRDPFSGFRTGGMRECWDHRCPSCGSVIFRGLSTKKTLEVKRVPKSSRTRAQKVRKSSRIPARPGGSSHGDVVGDFAEEDGRRFSPLALTSIAQTGRCGRREVMGIVRFVNVFDDGKAVVAKFLVESVLVLQPHAEWKRRLVVDGDFSSGDPRREVFVLQIRHHGTRPVRSSSVRHGQAR